MAELERIAEGCGAVAGVAYFTSIGEADASIAAARRDLAVARGREQDAVAAAVAATQAAEKFPPSDAEPATGQGNARHRTLAVVREQARQATVRREEAEKALDERRIARAAARKSAIERARVAEMEADACAQVYLAANLRTRRRSGDTDRFVPPALSITEPAWISQDIDLCAVANEGDA